MPLLLAAACGSSPSSPDSSKPLPVVQVTIAPDPVVATIVSIGPNGTVFRVQGTATFQETAGTAAHLTLVLGVVQQSSGGRASGTLGVDIQLVAHGSGTGMFIQDVALDNIANAVWQLSATGTDDIGRSFSTQIGQVAITPPAISVGR